MIKNILSKMTNIRFPVWSFPIILLGLSLISFGLLIPHLGFYWDDWAQILVGHIFGTRGYWDYFASDRPLSAWTHSLFYPILGDTPANWQGFTLLLRYATALFLYWMIKNLWPGHRRQAIFISLLFLVYPVFTQQATSVAYHQHWLQYLFFFSSLGFMVYSFRKPQYHLFFSVISLLFLLLQLSITEYFVGLELIRPLLLWIIISESTGLTIPGKIVSTIKNWSPYLIILIIFSIWRLFIQTFPTGEDFNQPAILINLLTQPVPTLQYLINFVSLDTLYILISSWARLLDIHNFQSPQRFTQISWLIGLVSFFGLFYYLVHLEIKADAFSKEITDDSYNQQNKWLKQAFILGLFALILGPMPAWLIDKQILLDTHSNRFAIPAMFGASLLCVVFIEWVSPDIKQKSFLISFLIGLSLILHLQTANEYRWLWTDQTRFYWQLYWRAPSIQSGTAIISEDELFPDQGLFSTSSAINLLYPQSSLDDGLDYWVYTLNPKFTYLTSKPDSVPFNTKFRSLSFSSSTPNSIMIYKNFEEGNCLWVLSPDDANEPELSELTVDWLYLSNPDQIVDGGDNTLPPVKIFGAEPDRNWCYYFQKADLSRQSEDWQQIVELGDQAQTKGYNPKKSSSNTPREWIPFIQGYALTGNVNRAAEITLAVAEQDPTYTPKLCSVWSNINKYSSTKMDIIEEQREEIFTQLSCLNNEE